VRLDGTLLAVNGWGDSGKEKPSFFLKIGLTQDILTNQSFYKSVASVLSFFFFFFFYLPMCPENTIQF